MSIGKIKNSLGTLLRHDVMLDAIMANPILRRFDPLLQLAKCDKEEHRIFVNLLPRTEESPALSSLEVTRKLEYSLFAAKNLFNAINKKTDYSN